MTKTELAAAFRSIAGDIERHGHYQDQPGQIVGLDAMVCLVYNPTLIRGAPGFGIAVSDAMEAKLGVAHGGLSLYSNRTPTDVLLRQLRTIADDLEDAAAPIR